MSHHDNEEVLMSHHENEEWLMSHHERGHENIGEHGEKMRLYISR